MDKLLIIIDVQNGFINNATKFIPNCIEKLLSKNIFNKVIFTKYINDENSIFYKSLNYKGCITEEERKIVVDTKNYQILEKRTYTAFNDELRKYIKKNNIRSIYLCGIDTDACVLKTALDLFDNNYDVKIIEDCSMSHLGIIYHNYAIQILKNLIGENNIIKMLDNDNR